MSGVEHFQFDLPKGWLDQTVYVFNGPEIEGQSHVLVLAIDRFLQHDDIGDYKQEKMQAVFDSLQGIEILKDEETTISGGNPAWEVVYKWIPSEGVTIIRKYVFVFAGGLGLSFSCGFSKASYKMLGGQFKEVIESLAPGTYEPLEED